VTTTVAVTRTATTAPRTTPKPSTETPAPAKPEVLGGRLIYDVFLGGVDFNANTINVANVSTGAAGQLIGRASWGALSPDGSHIAYFHWTDGLHIANSDGGGDIGPLYVSPGVCCLNWSRDGVWIVFADSPVAKTPGGPIKMLKVDGAYKTIVNLNVSGNGPAFSPDGKHIVFSGCQPNTNQCGLHVVPTDGNGAVRVLTTDNGGDAQWSPDGKKLVYQSSDDAGNKQVFVINADGSGARKQLTNGKSNDGQPAWSRQGGSIFWRSDQNGTAWAIFVMNADGSNKRRLVSSAAANPDLWGWQSISVAP
jgi:Tol biopolymer transport system component